MYNIAVVGATGLVGRTMLKVLEERNFPVNSLTLLASERGAGTPMIFKGIEHTVKQLKEDSFSNIDIALFSAGKEVSVRFAPIAAQSKCVVIDNGSYWRMHPDVPLIVPEVNPDEISVHHGIIANPNCSTIQLVVALKPIHDNYRLKRIIVSTYQSISGAGQKGIDQLIDEIAGIGPRNRVSSHQVAYNTVFHKITDESGYSEEEIKMVNEPRKIMNVPDVKVSVTCVRLPVLGGHGESVNIQTENPFEINDIRTLLSSSKGVKVIDEPISEQYPTPIISKDSDYTYVGRIRRDDTAENCLNMWIVADNVRKGAATNAVQIAELIAEKNLLKFENISW